MTELCLYSPRDNGAISSSTIVKALHEITSSSCTQVRAVTAAAAAAAETMSPERRRSLDELCVAATSSAATFSICSCIAGDLFWKFCDIFRSSSRSDGVSEIIRIIILAKSLPECADKAHDARGGSCTISIPAHLIHGTIQS